jgi:hypothetical protein
MWRSSTVCLIVLPVLFLFVFDFMDGLKGGIGNRSVSRKTKNERKIFSGSKVSVPGRYRYQYRT